MNQSVFAIVGNSWRLAFRNIVGMPVLSGSTLLTVVLCGALVRFLPTLSHPDRLMTQVALLVAILLVTVASFVVTTSFIVVMHRATLLNDERDRLVWRLAPNVWWFALWLILLQVICIGLLLLGSAFRHSTIASLILSLLSLVATLRLSLMFPAIAIRSPGLSLVNAWRDGRSHGLVIFAVLLLQGLTFAILGGAGFAVAYRLGVVDLFRIGSTATHAGGSGMSGFVVSAVLSVLLGVVSLVAAATIACSLSLLFRAFANRLVRGPSEPVEWLGAPMLRLVVMIVCFVVIDRITPVLAINGGHPVDHAARRHLATPSQQVAMLSRPVTNGVFAWIPVSNGTMNQAGLVVAQRPGMRPVSGGIGRAPDGTDGGTLGVCRAVHQSRYVVGTMAGDYVCHLAADGTETTERSFDMLLGSGEWARRGRDGALRLSPDGNSGAYLCRASVAAVAPEPAKATPPSPATATATGPAFEQTGQLDEAGKCHVAAGGADHLTAQYELFYPVNGS